MKASIIILLFFAFWFRFATYAKRLHDVDKNGWWMLVGLIPVVGYIWLFYQIGLKKGTDGMNRYGMNPLN